MAFIDEAFIRPIGFKVKKFKQWVLRAYHYSALLFYSVFLCRRCTSKTRNFLM